MQTVIRALFWLLVCSIGIAALLLAAKVGDNNRCKWLSEHRATHPYGYAYYCTQR